MNAYKELFHKTSDAIELLSMLCNANELSLDSLRQIGSIIEELKEAQIRAEEYYIGERTKK